MATAEQALAVGMNMRMTGLLESNTDSTSEESQQQVEDHERAFDDERRTAVDDGAGPPKLHLSLEYEPCSTLASSPDLLFGKTARR